MNNNFRFWIPLDKIKKSKDDKGNPVMKLGGMASTSRRDTDGESLDPSNFDIDYLKEKGIVNWNHNKSPDAVIGEPTKVEKRNGGLYVESMLYPDNALSKSVWELAETLEKNSKTRRLGYSVEGKATERDPLDKTKVTKAMITNIALTISPKNPDSIVDIIKGNFHDFDSTPEDLNKSIDEIIEDIHEEIEKGEVPEMIDGNIQENRNGGDKGKESHDKIVNIVRPDGMRITVDSQYCVTIDKALDTATGSALRKEHVDSDLKDLQKAFNEELMQDILKSDSVISFEQADLIYNNVQQKLNTMILKDTEKKLSNRDLINKALEELNSDSLNKGEEFDDEEYITESEDTNIKKGDYGSDDVEDSQEEGDEDEEDEENEDKDDNTNKKKANKKKDSDSEDEEMYNDDTQKSNTDDLQKSLTEQITKQGMNLGTIMKGLFDEIKHGNENIIKSLQEEVFELRSEIAKSNQKIDELSNTPMQRKSIVRAVDRTFEKGISNDELGGGTPVNNKLSKSQVLSALEKLTFEKGFNEEISKSLISYETTNSLSDKVKSMVEELTGGKV